MKTTVLFCVLAVTLCPGGVRGQTAECDVIVNSALPEEDRQDVTGTVTFDQPEGAGELVTITVTLSGFNTSDGHTKHGFHVHTDSDMTDGCDSTGGHFNPNGDTHGAPGDTVRHVGDLGNIVEDGNGDVAITFDDSVIDFTGTNSILGRALVIHAHEDDLGLGGHPDSNKTGNAGPRLACCIITSPAGGGGASAVSASASCIAAIFVSLWALL